jgi:hypothetical protein
MLNSKGDFLQGVADMDVLTKLDKDHLNRFNIEQSKIVFIDSNISEEILESLLSRT